MSTSNKKPVDTIRDGSLRAVIWANFGEKGTFYSVQLTRSYQDAESNWHESDSFTNSQLLRVARLAHIAYDEILIRRSNDKAQAKGGES
ncbi:MAG: hypothetical protein JKY43_04990 [Phycisphaerales bacterium]|nr:hypothetical protein [Phycisphaerales bacterium]